MSGGFERVDFEGLLRQTRDSLRTAREAAAETAEARTGEGVALDGQVRVEVGADGLVSGVEFGSRVMYLSAEDLGEVVREAVNAALLDAKSGGEFDGHAPDLGALEENLRDLQDQGLDQMRKLTEVLNNVWAKVEARR
ncbi:YbaB/EbfC family nucleoid-associated protein [Phytomonospora sp. NPDC050363]|uniref:YbaB/EbfC family nucleoid-associated protein n=1 Tax=Phytomonospora sp. NPDC050363 TaxID=3155642 RepID=UPI0033F446AF